MALTQKLACRIERIVDHGERVYTVTLRPERPAPRFRAGQFLHLALDPYDPSRFWPESRVFSIASSPAARDVLRLTYSVRGRFTARMEAELAEGGQIWIKMPYGDFVIDSAKDAVLFAGGTGISAFSAFLEGLGPTSTQAITIAYGARTRDLLIYRDVVERSVRNGAATRVMFFVEEQAGGASGGGTEHGRVSVAATWPFVARPFEAAYYISGPPAMLRSIAHDLQERGVTAGAIHIDAWE